MESLNSKPTSYNKVGSEDDTKDPKVTAEETEQDKEAKELDKLFNESIAMYKTAMSNTIKAFRKGEDENEKQ